MAASVLVDSGFLVALLSARDRYRQWAQAQARRHAPPWQTCEAVLSESFHLLGQRGREPLAALLSRRALLPTFNLGDDVQPVMRLMQKYASVPMSLADACLVRMTEKLPDPVLLTTDRDFLVYRRHTRQVVPCVVP